MGLTTGTALKLAIADHFALSQTLRCDVVGIASFSARSDPETVLVRTVSPLTWRGREYPLWRFGHAAVRGSSRNSSSASRLSAAALGSIPTQRKAHRHGASMSGAAVWRS